MNEIPGAGDLGAPESGPSEATPSGSLMALEESAILSRLWDYWRSKLRGRVMPLRSDIEPSEIPRLLPYLQLVENIAGRYRYRLTGTAIAEAYGYELTGKFVDEAIPVGRRTVAAHHFDLVSSTRRPLFARNLYATARGTEIVVSRVILPLGKIGPEVAMLLLGHAFAYRSQYADKLGNEASIQPSFGLQEFLSGTGSQEGGDDIGRAWERFSADGKPSRLAPWQASRAPGPMTKPRCARPRSPST